MIFEFGICSFNFNTQISTLDCNSQKDIVLLDFCKSETCSGSHNYSAYKIVMKSVIIIRISANGV